MIYTFISLHNKTRMRKVVDVRTSLHVRTIMQTRRITLFLDLFGIFLQSLIKWLVSQQINRLPHVNFVLPNSCVNILYHIVSLKLLILFCDCVILHFLRVLEFFLHNMIKLNAE